METEKKTISDAVRSYQEKKIGGRVLLVVVVDGN